MYLRISSQVRKGKKGRTLSETIVTIPNKPQTKDQTKYAKIKNRAPKSY